MTVYVVQEPTRRDKETGVMERMMDLSPAAEFGQIENLLPSLRLPLDPLSWIPRLRAKLYRFTDDDYLLPVGDLTAIAAASAMAAHYNRGRLRILKWDRQSRRYLVQQLDVAGEKMQ